MVDPVRSIWFDNRKVCHIMRIIGIETSSVYGGVAVLEINNSNIILLKEISLGKGLIHGKLLVPALDRLLKRAGWQKENIDLIAVDIGPGSYTGLRVGVAIAKTMAYVLRETKIVGVPSIDVLLDNIPHNNGYRYLCPVIDAKWNQVYTALYEKDKNSYKRITDYLAISPDDLVKLLNKQIIKGGLLLFGDAINTYSKEFERLEINVVFGAEELWYPKARDVALLGYKFYKDGKIDNPVKLLPLYLRVTEAEMNLKTARSK